MMRFGWLAMLAFMCVVPVGCGQTEQSAPSSEANSAPETQGSAIGRAATAEQAVFAFLEAVRLGDDDRAGQMLTAAAQKKTAELDMVVAPPGSDTASFKIGETKTVSSDGAHVASAWTDLDQEANRRTDQITWILRRESVGWRIAGMATKIFSDQDPVVLNFENPEEMLEKQRLAEEEALRRANQHQFQAARPEDPFQSKQR